MKKIPLVVLLLSLNAPALAGTQIYNMDQSPYELRRESDPYGPNNTYSQDNPNNPYSVYQSRYNPQSVTNDSQEYTDQVSSFNGKYQGQINGKVTDPHSINNPYGMHGNHYDSDYAGKLYDFQDNGNNPYSTFREPYDPNSINKSPNYAEQYADGYGNGIGSAQNNFYGQESVLNPYSRSGNPYNAGNLNHPYSHSPYHEDER